MYKRPFALFLFVLILFSCRGNNSAQNADNTRDSVYRIDLVKALQSSKQIKLSDIGDSVEYFELKTPKNLPIVVSHIYVTKEYIFINSKGIVYKFDLAGNYLGSIGRRGRGPGEYIAANELLVNETDREIYVYSYPNLLTYSFDGNYIKTAKKETRYRITMFFDQGLMYESCETYGSPDYKLIAINNTGDTVLKIPNTNLFDARVTFGTASTFRQPLYKYDGSLYFKGYNDNDTVYHVDKTGYQVHAVIDMGQFKRPESKSEGDMILLSDDFVSKKGNYYYVNNFLEDDRYFYLYCRPYYDPEMNSPLVIFDKASQNGFCVRVDEGNFGLTDDIGGGADFIPLFITDEYYVSVANAVDFIDKNASRQGISEPLKLLLKNINEDSNQIVTLVKIKK